MDISEIRDLYDRQQRVEIEFPGVDKLILPDLVRFSQAGTKDNFILFSKLNENNADQVIQDQITYFRSIGQPFVWKLYDHDTPADLKDRLIKHGFVSKEPDAVMVLDLQETPDELLSPIQADVRLITDPDQLIDVIKILKQVWDRNFDWVTKRLGDDMRIPGYLNIYVAYWEGQPACAGWVFFYPKSQFADLRGGSTVPEFRKHGLYTAVLAARVQEAIRHGYRFLVIDASPMSRPIVASHGFKFLDYVHVCDWKPD
ncbi:MAG: GNAT family N-acetyltransferase [Anaerolineaceae bacterium]|nr:GNAT family N-acetyltransferase [Anaerolineaceae bacterium]